MDQSRKVAIKNEVERAPLALAELLNSIRTHYESRAKEKGLGFKLETVGLLPRHIVSDASLLRQLLDSVIGNSLKFTERGRIHIRVGYRRDDDKGHLLFQISDTGRGMSEAEVWRLFQSQLSIEAGAARRFGEGSLSLMIARNLAELLGGELILIKTQVGVGSCFQISVDPGPIREDALIDGAQFLEASPVSRLASTSLDASPRLDDRRVLVVDDSADNRNLMVRIISRLGAAVETACDGAEAIEKALHGNFDLVLMDIQMPGTDGYEATAQLRRRGYRKPILALTAHAMQEDRGRCREVGCDDHISKPVNFRVLMQSIVEHMHRYELSSISS